MENLDSIGFILNQSWPRWVVAFLSIVNPSPSFVNMVGKERNDNFNRYEKIAMHTSDYPSEQ